MFRVSRILPLVLVLALVGLFWTDATGQQATDASSVKKEAGQNKPPPMNVTPEREAAVKTFVERNHPELAELLAHLRENRPQEYERAIRELHRNAERLAGIQERDRTQYDLELKLWTAQSRVQLLTAKLRMDATGDLKTQLRDALNGQAEAKVALLKHERGRVADRLSKIDADIAQFEGNREKVIDRQMELLTRAASQGKGNKPATKAIVGKQGGKRASTKPTTNSSP
jgi:hypothetical protein